MERGSEWQGELSLSAYLWPRVPGTGQLLAPQWYWGAGLIPPPPSSGGLYPSEALRENALYGGDRGTDEVPLGERGGCLLGQGLRSIF